MAKDNVTTVVFRGKLGYPKVLEHQLSLNYNEDGKEWKFDFCPNDPANAAKELKRLGVEDRLRRTPSAKDDYFDGQPYMSFKQNEFKKDGEPNKPIRVLQKDGETPWPQTEEAELGNNTVVDLKFVVIDNGKGKFKGVYPRSIRVLEHKPFYRKEFDDLSEDDEYYGTDEASGDEQARKDAEYSQFQKDFDLDDDINDLGNEEV